jgi:hypothetical protein
VNGIGVIVTQLFDGLTDLIVFFGGAGLPDESFEPCSLLAMRVRLRGATIL